jgi:hypothetical protein
MNVVGKQSNIGRSSRTDKLEKTERLQNLSILTAK